MYKLTASGASVIRMADGVVIPLPTGGDGFRYMDWLSLGNVPLPADEPTRPQVQSRMWDAIKAERDRRIQGGGYTINVTINAVVVPKWFHSDTFSRTQQEGMVLMGANLPGNLQWKTMDGSFVAMTPALASAVFNSGAANDNTIFTQAETHKAAMLAAADPAAYVFTTGWPPAFGA
jgi:Domain of unknown function (DUF4376)